MMPLVAAAPFPLSLAGDVGGMLSNDFMRYAFLAGTAMALSGGLAGYFVVLRHATFAGEALSHGACAAALGAALLGVDLLAGMFVLTVAAALAIGALAGRVQAHDVAVGTVLAFVLGLGALFLSVYTSGTVGGSNGQIGVNILFCSILGVQLPQAREAVAVGLGASVVLAAIARPLLFASLDPLVATARGVRVRLVGIVFLALLALTVSEAVQVVGALLVLALLVMPAAIAQRLTARPFRALWLSAALGVAITWAGLTIGYYTPYPVSFLITSIAFALYVGTVAWRYLRTGWTDHPRVRRVS